MFYVPLTQEIRVLLYSCNIVVFTFPLVEKYISCMMEIFLFAHGWIPYGTVFDHVKINKFEILTGKNPNRTLVKSCIAPRRKVVQANGQLVIFPRHISGSAASGGAAAKFA